MRILFYLRALNIGGAETFIYNFLEKVDVSECDIDIVLQSTENKNKRLLSLCKRKDVKIFYIEPFEKHFFKSYMQLVRLIKDGNYNIIHYHANSLINSTPLFAALKTKCKLVVHSHNSRNNIGGLLGKVLHYTNRTILNRCDVIRFACSELAGKWMFGNMNYKIIYNGINLETYKYDISNRNELRMQYGIKLDTMVWGHVGRFVAAKNHEFLIKCFEEYNNRVPNAKLFLLGDGPLLGQIKQITSNDNIVFLGGISETNKYYSMFDVMVFPSVFEGLPFTLIEAQASGLPIIASDNITKMANVTDLISYCSLEADICKWVEMIPEQNSSESRSQYVNFLRPSIFNSENMAIEIINIYKSIINN